MNTLISLDLRKLWQCAHAGTTPDRAFAFFFLAPASAPSILGSGSVWAGLASCFVVPGEHALP